MTLRGHHILLPQDGLSLRGSTAEFTNLLPKCPLVLLIGTNYRPKHPMNHLLAIDSNDKSSLELAIDPSSSSNEMVSSLWLSIQLQFLLELDQILSKLYGPVVH
uniref:Uncharacterized protein n=1 Tax=Schistocephalus solidus TaxID=70667 RepID=A0A0V0J2L4_SCHSO